MRQAHFNVPGYDEAATTEAKLGQMPQNYIKLDENKSKSMMRLLEMLDDHDDVQNVWSNFDIPEEMMESA